MLEGRSKRENDPFYQSILPVIGKVTFDKESRTLSTQAVTIVPFHVFRNPFRMGRSIRDHSPRQGESFDVNVCYNDSEHP